MAATHISTTRRGAYNALRHQGILVTDSWAQLSSMLEKSLSQRHALFLAEPVHESSGASTDWYSAAEGEVRPLNSLPEDEQRKARQEFSALATDINRLAAELKNDPNAARNIRGNILSLALRYPGEDCLYMVGGQPVLTGWGFEPGTAGAQPEDLMRLGAAVPLAASAPPPPPPPLPASGFAWWRALLSFLLGILLLIGLFYLAGMLFGPAGCAPGIALPGGCAPGAVLPGGCAPGEFLPGGCAPALTPKEPEVNKELVSAMTAEQEKERSLRAELEDLRRRLAERAALCKPPVPEIPAEPPKEPESPPEEQIPPVEETPEEAPSLADLMPTTPEAPIVPETPRETPKPPEKPREEKPKAEKPRAQAPKRGEDMTIPDSARQNKDTGFLEGCWNSETGLMSTSGEPVTVQYCFDGNGNGSRTVTRQKSGDRCTGSVRARFDNNGRLILNADGAPCAKGGGFVPHKVECTPGANGKAQCQGQEQGRRNKWDARFRRS